MKGSLPVLWFFHRLMSMSFKEVLWRFGQKRLQYVERRKFGEGKFDVGGGLFNHSLSELHFDADSLGINFKNKKYGVETSVHLLKGPDYCRWPNIFSYSLNYKQRDDLGDARTNWEKHRHHEWTLMAKRFFVTEDESVFSRLNDSIELWMAENPFLYGISWTSPMEFALRSVNWMYALAFVRKAGKDLPRLETGILNISDYLTHHLSRFSSANNHLIVEATAIGLAGYCFNHEEWRNIAIRILTEELGRQNYPDGMNREMSLHYQTFGMEAYLILAHVSGETIWDDMLKREAEFVTHSSWKERSICKFGDDDEGKILDLQGGEWNHWEWVLQLASLVLGTRYSTFDRICENTRWMFDEDAIHAICEKSLYDNSDSRVFPFGGNSFLRDVNDRILIAIDHAELGFGNIAAHGHADALSFQMLVDGIPVFTDPGTYIYHCWREKRDFFRKTINHNTLCLGGKDQSKILGPFLWGHRAECTLLDYRIGEDYDMLLAEHNGYKPVIHQRKFLWDKRNCVLQIEDSINQESPYVLTFIVGSDCTVKDDFSVETPSATIKISFVNYDFIKVEDIEISREYGLTQPSKVIRLYGHERFTTTTMDVIFAENAFTDVKSSGAIN